MADTLSPHPVTTHGLWAQTSAETPPRATSDETARVDVAIVGGGFCGLSAALHLAEAGVEVTVLEAHGPGFGASGRNGGQVIAGLKMDPAELRHTFGPEAAAAMFRFGAGTADLVYSIIERFQIRCEAHRDGWIQAGRSPAMIAAIGERVAAVRKEGQDVELIEGERLSALTGTGYHGVGMLDRRCGTVQPLAFTRGLAAAAEACGARVLHDRPVTKLRRDGADWIVETAAGSVRARQVLIAANAYIGDLYPPLKAAMITVESIQIATDPLTGDLARTVLPSHLPVSDLMDLGVYFRRDDAGRFVIGGSGSLTDRQDPKLYDALARSARVLYPGLKQVAFTSRWGGRLTLTRDHLPRLISPEQGLHIAYGCNGRGVALMTAMGKLAADNMGGSGRSELPIARLPPLSYPFHAVRLPAMMAVRRFRALRRRFARA